MAAPIRAVYENGKLSLLGPVDLSEGQEITIMILSDRERVKAALGDILAPAPTLGVDEADIDEEALLEELDRVSEGMPPVSEIIIEERHEGP